MHHPEHREWNVARNICLLLALFGVASCSEKPGPSSNPGHDAAQTETIQHAAEVLGTRLVYVPAYRYALDQNGRTPLVVTLTVHNTSMRRVKIHAVEYFDADGVLVENLLPDPRELAALETIEFARLEGDVRGGSGANFLVAWTGEPGSQAPLAEALMVGHQGTGRLTFTSRGVSIDSPRPAPRPVPPATPQS